MVSGYQTRRGVFLAGQGQVDEAISSFRRAAELDPANAESHFNLGNALHQQSNDDAAIGAYRQALRARPDLAQAHNNIGSILLHRSDAEGAAVSFRAALALSPNHLEPRKNLAVALQRLGRLDEAVGHCQDALARHPRAADVLLTFAGVYQQMGRLAKAVAACQRALSLRPDFVEVYIRLGLAQMDEGHFDEAIASYKRAAALRPDDPATLSNLGSACKEAGLLDEAISWYRRAEAAHPDARVASNLVYTLHFHPNFGPRELLEEHRRWAQKYGDRCRARMTPHANTPDPAKRLRIGYVSPDFCNHLVGRFMMPLLAHHDHAAFEVFAYSDVVKHDVVTERLRGHVDQWQTTSGMSDDAMADQICADEIDVLVDLTMHMAKNRLLVFARKPAPVQVTYLAYCSTTGLKTIDYRLSDPYLDPAGMDDGVYSERTVRLPSTDWCYEPHPCSPELGPLPAPRVGHVTFGCLNNFCKVTEPTLKMWRDILARVAGSKLVVYSQEGSHRQRAREYFEKREIEANRIEFVARLPFREHLARYWKIDIGLDPFPYGGGTTTLDALWMGVPVVSLAGQTAVSRAGSTILSNVGLPELIATTPHEYVDIAGRLAADLARVAQLRETLRQRLSHSTLMDLDLFCRDIEGAYRRMWREWCETSGRRS